MKKYFILAAAALVAMCACTKNEVNIPDEEISFEVANYASATKADPAVLESNTDFAVYAYMHGLQVSWALADFASYSVYMNNVTIKHQSDGKWAADSKYYWPKTGQLSFLGYSPAAANGKVSSDGIVFENFAIGITPGGYTNAGWAKANNNYDLMWSNEDESKEKTVADATTNTYGHAGVPMLFHHALANLNFKAGYTEMIGTTNGDPENAFIGVQINSLELVDVISKGTFKSDATEQWTLSTTDKATPNFGTMKIEAGTASTVTAANYNAKAVEYLIIPQGAKKLVVKYQFITSATKTVDGVTSNVLSDVVTFEQELKDVYDTATPAQKIANWAVETKYTYTLTFCPVGDTPITFDPSVNNWTEVAAGGVAVE